MRAKKQPATPDHGNPGFHGAPPAGVQVVLFEDATKLYTHRMGDALCNDWVKGAIVKLVPEASTTAEERRGYRESLLNDWGAKHVWFAPARQAQRAAVQDAARGVVGETLRQAVDALLEKANSRDPAALRGVVDEALTKAGL